ncbi:MAG: PorT family protein [Bacteroidales bacterium]|nr:PorT family protein [Bacteroidales bacterium]
MDDRKANIDLLFRNGLKDFEVLPPPEVWNNILPAIRKKQRYVALLRTAAMVTLLVSTTFLAYRLSRQNPSSFNEPAISYGQDQIFDRAIPAEPTLVRTMPSDDRQTGSVSGQQADRLPGPDAESVEEQFVPAAFVARPGTPDISNSLMKPSSLIGRPSRPAAEFNPYAGNNPVIDPLVEEPVKKDNKWRLTAMDSPMYYLRPGSGQGDFPGSFPLEQPRMSYSGGVGVSYKISKKLSIQSGLYYASIGNEVDNIKSFSGFSKFDYTKGDHNFEVHTSSGIILTKNPDVYLSDNMGDRVVTMYGRDVFDPVKANLPSLDNSLYQNFGYIEMPVLLRYKLIDRAVDFNLIGGMSYNLLVNNTVHAMAGNNRYDVGKTAGLNNFLVSSSLGMGMEYTLNDKISLNLEPTFRYYLNPFSNIGSITVNPYSFGIFSGLSYRF